MLYDTRPDNDFMDITPKAQATKSKNSQVGLHKIKKLLHNKGSNHQSEKATHEMGENIYKLYTWWLISKIYNVFLQLKNKKKSNNTTKKKDNDLSRHFSKEETQMVNRYMKNAQYHWSSVKCK